MKENENTELTVEEYTGLNYAFEGANSDIKWKLYGKVDGKQSQDIYISMLKDEYTELGYAYKEFVNCGFVLGMEREVFNDIKRLLDETAKDLKWEVDEWRGTQSIVMELMEEFRHENEKAVTLNQQQRNFPGESKEGIAYDLAELVYIMDKDIHGELGTEETALLERNMTKYQKHIQIMREQLKTIDH